MDKLNLLILGEQKCGTHSLKMCLNQHSKIDMIVKELHIFDNPPQRALKKVNIVINERIERKKENQNLKIGAKYLGEGTPLYLYNKQSVPNSLRYNKDMKYIVVLRNPYERAFSAHNMLTNKNIEKRPFEIAIKEDFQQLDEKIPRNFKNARSHYLRRGMYVDQLKELYKEVDSKNIHVVLCDNLWKNPNDELKKIFNFLEIQYEPLQFKHANKGNYKDKTIHPLADGILHHIYRQKNRELETFLGIPIPWDK